MGKKISVISLIAILALVFNAQFAFGAEEEAAASGIETLSGEIDYAQSVLGEAQQVYNATLFTSLTTPVRLYGYYTARYQNTAMTQQAVLNHSSFESFLAMWIDGAIDRIAYKMLLNLERPADDGRITPNYWGTGRVFIDEFKLSANMDILKFSTGFLWVNSFLIQNATLTNRPMLFEKDFYQGNEEGTKAKYDNAFLKGLISRDQRWTNIPLMGGTVEFDVFGRGVKVVMGKLNRFYDDYTPVYRYLTDAKVSMGNFLNDFFIIDKWDASFEAYNVANNFAETLGLTTPVLAESKKENNTIYYVDTNMTILDIFKLSLAYGKSNYRGPEIVSIYGSDINGEYFFGGIKGDFIKPWSGFNLPLGVNVFKIDPTYVALLSNIVDSRKRGTSDIAPTSTIYTDISDPGLMSTNSQGLLVNTQFRVPNVLITMGYGYREQIKPSSNNVVMAHFLNGSNLNMALWWHAFYSSYGYPAFPRDNNWANYNATYNDSTYGPVRNLLTGGWRDNQEVIALADAGSRTTPAKDSIKFLSNANMDLRFDISGMFGWSQSLYAQFYTELYTLDASASFFPDFDPEATDRLFVVNINDVVVAYNVINPVNLLFEYGWESWQSKASLQYDVDYLYQTYGFGVDWDPTKAMNVYFKVKYFTFDDGVTTKDTVTSIQNNNSHSGYWLFFEVKNFF